MKRHARWLLLSLSILGAASIVELARAEEQPASDRLMLSCNEDGTWTCGYSCMVQPYYGRWCCET